ncbi:MAG: DedA family protein [Proteobacteria bacterium]|nr:DedA family protein [Pseudomonadota bacterium]
MFLVKTAGLAGVIAVVFAESGLFFGFFFPGDSLLFTAGLLASQGFLPIGWLLVGVAIAAVVGDSVGYWFGKKTGPAIFSREDSLFFHKKHVVRAQKFYEVHGKKTIILARFVPIVRTFAPILAGVGQMDYRTFLSFNVIGGLAWSLGLTTLGYFLGSLIPSIDHYLLPIVLLIIAISFIPIVSEYLRSRRNPQ